MSIDDLATGIGGSRESVNRAAGEVLAMKTKAEELSTAFSGMSAESMSAYMTEVAGQLDTAHQTLTGVADGLEQTQSTAAGAKQHQGGLLGGGTPGSTPTAARRPTFKAIRTDPGKRDEIAPYVGLNYAVATLWDRDGNEVVGVHSADDDGPAKDANWKQPWVDYPRLRRHVEAHAAARMHRDGHNEMAMYINMAPCTYPDGCKVNLRDLVPGDSTLYVHWVKPDGTVRVMPFKGTGKAIDD